MSGRAPSDWEMGVLAAAAWMKTHGTAAMDGFVEKMLRDIKKPDTEGTEERTVRQIVQWVREQGFGQTGETRVACSRLAVGIEKRDWRMK